MLKGSTARDAATKALTVPDETCLGMGKFNFCDFAIIEESKLQRITKNYIQIKINFLLIPAVPKFERLFETKTNNRDQDRDRETKIETENLRLRPTTMNS